MTTNEYDMPVREVLWQTPDVIDAINCTTNRVTLSCPVGGDRVLLEISFPSGGGIRINTQKKGYFEPSELQTIQCDAFDGGRLITAADNTQVRLTQKNDSFTLTLINADGSHHLILDGNQILLGYDGGEWVKAAYRCKLSENEKIYGFGERFNTLNHRGTHFTLWNMDYWSKGTTAYKNMPIFHSTAGYMMFFNSTYSCEADIGAQCEDEMCLEFEGPKWDAYFFLDLPLENIRQYTNLTGKPILPPQWALRYWAGGAFQVWEEKGISKYLDVVTECMEGYKKLGIPNLAALFGEGAPFHEKPAYEILKQTGTRMLAWNHPSMMFSDMKRILNTDNPEEIPYFKDPEDQLKQAGREVIDFVHPNAVRVISDFFHIFWDWGLKGCMVDYGEILPVNSLSSNGMTGDEMHNFVSYWYNKAYHDAWTERMGDDHILFSRSGCAGCQRWIANFGGDQVSDFSGMRQALNGMLNLTACGFSLWGTDIGGYGGPVSPQVYIRWLQFGAFNPIMRAHGAGGDRNPWSYGELAVKVFLQLYWLRENLQTYLFSHAVSAHLTGLPMTQAMAMAFPEEKLDPDINGQFLFCDDLLVCPVVEDSMEKEVLFPNGSWYDLFSGEKYSGGTNRKIYAPLEKIPVYIRAGSVIPLCLGESGRLSSPVSEDNSKSGLLITPPDSPRETHVYTSENSKMDYQLEPMNKSGFRLTASQPVNVEFLLVYGCEIESVTVDGTVSDSSFEKDAQSGYIKVELPEGYWKTIEIRYSNMVI